MLRLAGEIADGVLLNVFTTPRYVRELARPQLAAGAERAGRAPRDLELACVVVAAVADDRAQARAWARQHLAWYGILPYFDTMFSLHGFGDSGAAIRDAFARGDWDAQVAAVDDELLDTFAVAGTPDDCRSRLRAWADEVDVAVLYPATVAMGADEVRENRRAIAETFARDTA
jgi:alkanesulfonate monooxygenase SsuD/methylene tetrahydromethanopterin reductase-like flavin-dependent oxidoreductase (luciferase family)